MTHLGKPKTELLPWVDSLTPHQQQKIWLAFRQWCALPSQYNDDDEEEFDDEKTDIFEDYAAEIKAGINPFTGEVITTNRAEIESDLQQIIDDFDKFPDFLTQLESASEADFDDIWNQMWDYLATSDYFDAEEFTQNYLLEVIDEDFRDELIDSFHTFYGRDPQYERELASYESEIKEAKELAAAGDTSRLNALNTPSPLANAAREKWSRIAQSHGKCFVCGKLVKAYDGELLLWNEIPKEIRDEFLPGVFKKWHLRHFYSPCVDDYYGKREHVKHVKVTGDRRNAKPEECWLCGVMVAEKEGWLVSKDDIPKWKQKKRAFPGAKEKLFYVQCRLEE